MSNAFIKIEAQLGKLPGMKKQGRRNSIDLGNYDLDTEVDYWGNVSLHSVEVPFGVYPTDDIPTLVLDRDTKDIDFRTVHGLALKNAEKTLVHSREWVMSG